MLKERVDGFIRDHSVVSHALTHYAGQITGFNLGYYLSNPRNNLLCRELNGVVLGTTLGLIGNLGLYWYRHSDHFQPPNDQEEDSAQEAKTNTPSENLEDSAEFIGEVILSAVSSS
jgi:hypothetical protein